MTELKVIALRTLNYLRAEHLPSYVALRMLLESTARDKFDSIMDAILVQSVIRRHDRLLELRRFKSREGEKSEYRKYYIPSPTSALADSYALAALHACGILKRSPEVFSYRPPSDKGYGRNFEHFAEGYAERNSSISLALSKSRDFVAIVTDIKSFYPSIDGNKVLAYLHSQAEAVTMSDRQKKIVFSSAERAVCSENGGLRIGMEMSHALASLYLSEMDQKLRLEFPGRYFRYVDDIVMVVPRSQVSAALDLLDS